LGRQRVRGAMHGRSLAEASQLLRPLYARTTKEELGLPPVTPVLRSVELPPLHREIYDALMGQFSLRATGVEDDFLALGRISMYMLMAAISPALLSVGTTRYEPLAYQVPPIEIAEGTPLFDLMRDLPNYEVSPKYLEALAIVDQNSSQGRKTIVWSTFIRSLNTLGRMMDQFQPATVHGGTDERDAEIDRFRNDPACMVLLSNPATLGEGISLHQVCHDAIYVDRDFSAGKYLQSLDRIHRLGLPPDTETRISVLVSRDTIDDVVTQRLDDKILFMRHILDDPALQQIADLDEEPSVGGGLDRQDIQALMGYLRDRDQ
jgi:SNF2 family DNA or RNA helicase